MTTYWAGTAQLLAVLVLAFVVEVRGISKTWREAADWTTPIFGVTAVAALGSAGWVIVESLKAALPGAAPRLDLVPLAQAAVVFMISALVFPPALTVLTRSFSAPLAAAFVWLTPQVRSIRRELRGMRRANRLAKRRHRKATQRIEELISGHERLAVEIEQSGMTNVAEQTEDQRATNVAALEKFSTLGAQMAAARRELTEIDEEIAEAIEFEKLKHERFESTVKVGREWLRAGLAGFPDPPEVPPWEHPQVKGSRADRSSVRAPRSYSPRTFARRRRDALARRGD